MPLSWSGLVTAGLVASAAAVHSNLRQAASPSYAGHNACPLSCAESGPSPANWTAYGNIKQAQRCQQTVYYHFNIHGKVDDASASQLVFACTADGPAAFSSLPSDATTHKTFAAETTTLDATYAVTRWANLAATGATEDLRNTTDSMLGFLDNGYGTTSNTSASPFIFFAQSPGSTVGMYMGRAVDGVSTGTAALEGLLNLLDDHSAAEYSGVAMQLCGSLFDADHMVGYLATANRSFDVVQEALQTWDNGTCLPYIASESFRTTASFTSSLLSNDTSNSTLNSRAAPYHRNGRSSQLVARDDCTAIKVVSGDSCWALSQRCGISAADFTKYNPEANLCATLTPGQHVCCSAGTLPDFKPKPNANGTCATYTVVADDSCSAIGAAYGLTNDDIEGFNTNTWGWNGCSLLYVGANICLSSGDPPMPAALANALCGPQKPGTTVPTSGTHNLSSLNPCPLNACCDVWGQCGITKEFCTDTNTGAPGTAMSGTNGCISNCGTDIVQGSAPAQFIKLQYYEAFGMDRDCLYQDLSQLNLSEMTHIHFSFASMDSDYQISVGTSEYDKYEFNSFTRLGDSVHKVLTIGGWAFSTGLSTYQIFRDGVKPENREAMAKSIVSFVTDNNLDGIDLDWEYPGEPDIPGIPAGSNDEGDNYLEFLKVLKNMMPSGKTVSIAAPASYWYLKAFPIKDISDVIDYIVFMTYDLHGQWDVGSSWSQEGCDNGNCLRSHVNLTETMTSLAMVTKAGVPSGKVIVGVSSYGRSFAMSTAGCYSTGCTFTGTSTVSYATAGVCTNTSGYISDAEIYDILDGTDGQHLRRAEDGGHRRIDRSRRRSVSSRVNQYFVDSDSDSIIMVYDDIQWVAYMDNDIKKARSSKYAGLNLGGTTDWASDLETFNTAPNNYANWAAFRDAVKTGNFAGAGSNSMNRTGNWTELTCTTPAVADADSITAANRWLDLGCPTAVEEAVQAWAAQLAANADNSNQHFTSTVADFFHLGESTSCGEMSATGYCTSPITCQAVANVNGSGPAAYEIWNSFVFLHNLYYNHWFIIEDMAAVDIGLHQDAFVDTFAPIPPDNTQNILNLILAFVGLAGTVGVSSLFNSVLKSLPYFTTDFGKVAFDNYKDISLALVSFGVSASGDYIQANQAKWTAESQDSFKSFMGDTMVAWQDSTANTLKVLFNGEPDSLSLLQSVIANGHFIAGGDPETHILSSPGYTIDDDDASYMRGNVTRSYYAYMIPSIWSAVGDNAFVLDTQKGCDADRSTVYLPDDAATYCYDGTMYGIVYPHGYAQSCSSSETGSVCTKKAFSNPPGIDSLDGTQWGGVTVEDLVVGSVRTYMQNNNQNGGRTADPSDPGSLEDLMNGDITTPGYIIMPVCSAEYAWANWKAHGAKPSGVNYWPCGVYPSPNDCQTSSFTDQTSSASPTVEDCMGIANNIRGTQGQWTIQTAGKAQHKIASYGNCKFGVQATNLHGDISFKVGAQDIVDIITNAVSLYGASGKIGAKGYMDCDGNISTQDMEWGIY
ncbi:class 5 chitinase chi100 [Grosmannia clavigera kw1407]|uniref:chitinase n=1 Tax=Grosmannia clavigera (strain kw1407 / UAMH 11150) TaxID=655863 RepID=F0XU61_GROCL|nr:class 5 chitinase chi100 [Grosmannia clavigera kw1407]EFW98972.1 class 5 chitinase chi100 [Grosmannia clavigera kw1407]